MHLRTVHRETLIILGNMRATSAELQHLVKTTLPASSDAAAVTPEKEKLIIINLTSN